MSEEMTFDMIWQIFNNLGLPMLLLFAIYKILKKILPDIIKFIKNHFESQHTYYKERQERQDKLTEALIVSTERGNEIIGQNTAAMERNTKAFEQSTVLNERVVTALDSDLRATQIVIESLARHDRRAEHINTDLIKLVAQCDNCAFRREFLNNG